MQVSKSLINHLNLKLSDALEQSIRIINVEKLHGGSVNYSFKLQANSQSFFIKINKANSHPFIFDLELKGLQKLASTNTLKVPRFILKGDFENTAYFVLELVEQGVESPSFWESFGYQLAALHQNSESHFGLAYQNYMGSLAQINTPTDSWASFFGNHRIKMQAEMAYAKRLIDSTLLKQIEGLTARMDLLFPKTNPALLHGDLWSGNFMANTKQQAVVFDPAVYYGNREMDLAMSLLFGGFDKRFYEAYNEYFPLEKGWEERVDLCNIYPLLVHVNLFGAAYSKRLKSALKKYL